MYALLVCGLLTVIPLGTLVGAENIPSRPRGHLAKRYALQDLYQGDNFFSHVSWWPHGSSPAI